MATILKKKKFKLKSEAQAWAKKEKAKASDNLKWETNRTQIKSQPWEAILYKA